DGKSLIYSPAADFFGEEVFTYTAGNNTGDASATVTIQVFPIQDLPTANDDVITTVTEDSSNVALDLLINDTIAPDANESLSIVFITQGTQGGTVAVSDSGEFVLYTPAVNFDGTDTFTYTIRDSNGGEDTATVTVDLQAAADVPTAGDDAFPVDEDVVDFPLDVLDNDSSNAVGGGAVTVVAVGTPDQGGVVSIAADGLNVLYSPAPDFFGTETFSYTVNDEGGLSAQATVTVTVGNIADSPQANDDAFTVVIDSPGDELDVLDNDTHLPDPTELLTITSVTTSSEGGTINIINSGSSLTYAPPTGFSGQDAFSYTITDEDGLTDEAVVTISIFDYIPGGLAGLVYIDADGDGVQDANELVLGGIKIHLTGTTSGGESIDLEMLTSEQGLYEFTDLESGSYTVTQTQPSFLVDGGFQGAAPNITFSSNSYSVELAEGQEISDGDFTEKGREASTLTLFDFFNRPAPPTLIGSFGDTVEDQWIAAHPAWVAFQDTSVVWDGGSHTLVVDVVRDDSSTDYGVLSPEAGDGIRQVTDEADTAVIFVTGLPDTYGIESQGSDDGGDGVPESEKVPDFSLEDVNTTSSLLGTDVSPRDYDGNVTAFYFGLATCSYCTTQFGHLNTMQNDFDSNDPDLGIEIVGINLAGRESGNASITAGNDIPWLQDVDLDENGEADAWEDWGAQLRDVIIVDAQNRQVSKINLTPNDLGDTAIYTLVRTMITDAIAAESEAEAELPEASVTAVQDTIDTIAEARNSQLAETVTAHDLALSSWF
ncbi:MAG: tandem-95 repeat protein, partial [Planctomycetaceae bacterium]|nr:tandem-95 repeat protein [Planctomycetaceae bacterium]